MSQEIENVSARLEAMVAGLAPSLVSVSSDRMQASGFVWRAGRVVTSDEGVAEDGTIEAIRIADAPGFALGVQWHAEYDAQRNPINRKLFQAFGDALRERRAA